MKDGEYGKEIESGVGGEGSVGKEVESLRWSADTTQDPVEPTSFWVNPFGVAWPLLKSSDLIRVDASGKVVDGGPCRLLNAAGTSPTIAKFQS